MSRLLMSLKVQGLQYRAGGVNGVIFSSSWVRPACDADYAKKLAANVKTFTGTIYIVII